MHIKAGLEWQINDERLEPALLALLDAIVEYGSLQQASEACGLSYRHSWGLLKKLEKLFNSPLVQQQRGRTGGTLLTQLGQAIRTNLQETESKLAGLLAEQSQQLHDTVTQFAGTETTATVRVSASSDLLIHLLSQSLQSQHQDRYEFTTRGSIESLRRLSKRQCDIVGFHLPLGRLWDTARASFKPWLDKLNPQLMVIATRRQGLMLRDTKKVHSLHDLCKRSVSFINRQEESGTRILFDELLKQHNIDKGEINGYNRTEYTHLAVADMINNGDVDAGFGIETAAIKFDLHFIPLVKELYLLAFRQGQSNSCVEEIQACLNSATLQAELSGLVGYKTDQTARMISLQELYAFR